MSDGAPTGRSSGASSRPGWGAVSLWLAALVLLFVPLPAAWVEAAYSQGIYRIIQRAIATLSSLVPIALFDILLIAVVGATLWWSIRGLWRPRTEGLRSLARLATLWSAVAVTFMLTWGLNFRRVPLRDTPAFDAVRVSPAAVRLLAERTVRTLNETRALIGDTLPSDAAMRTALAPHFRDASREVAGWSPTLSRPKATLLGWYMPRIGMNGYYLSVLHEIAINPDLLPFERPYVLAHEWAHGLGHANESEAAYVGWLACDRGPAWARYSAWLRVLDYLLDDLPRAELREVLAPLDSAVRADIRARQARQMLRFSPTMRRVNTVVQDGAAAVARVGEHQRDYDLLVQLILGLERRSADGVEVPVGAPEVRDTVHDHR